MSPMPEFPPFRLDTRNQCLWRIGERGRAERIVVKPKAFTVLEYLVEHAGRLVTHEELLEGVWPGSVVEPQAVKKRILDVRNALGDDPRKPLFIETIPRRGYRFIAPVRKHIALSSAAPLRDTLVGRNRALADLHGGLQLAARGERQVVFITGEAGIGKTALAGEFRRQSISTAFAIRTATGQCVEGYGGKEPYYPMLDALGRLCAGSQRNPIVRILAAQAPTWLVQFPALLKREHREMLQREILGSTRERMLREICEALETITAESPLLLVFEDLQWVDPATVDLISALARRQVPARLMLVATCRPLDLDSRDHPLKVLKQDLLVHRLSRELALAPLTEAEVGEYLAARSSGARLPQGLSALLHRHSEGNPLFMAAALDHMTKRALISRENGSWQLHVPLTQIDLAVPDDLRRMIEAQLERLTPEEQCVLELASVAGASFSSTVINPLGDVDPQLIEDLCEDLSRRRQIVRWTGTQIFPNGVTSERYEFMHALYRQVLYDRLAAGRRAKLHRRIGERLETLHPELTDAVIPDLAHHFEAGADWGRAVEYLLLEADIATQRFAHPRANLLLRRALELVRRLPQAERASKEMELLAKLAANGAAVMDARVIDPYEPRAAEAAQRDYLGCGAGGGE
jgi:predicted ATPase/DNA-binding winged helix-turn-helix (wHTH) protein